MTKNTDINKYKYSGYRIGFGRQWKFFISWYWIRQKCNNFWIRYEFINEDNRKKDILFLGKGATQGLEHTLTAETMCSITSTEHNKNFCLSLHHNGANIC